MKQLISIVLSIFLLVSSTGLTYAKHLCGDFVMMEKITFGEAELSCGMAMANDACDGEENQEHSCCDNEFTNITTDDNFAMSSFDIVFQDNFTAAFITVFVLEHPTRIKEASPAFLDYNPPPLLKDIPILYETFLI